VREGDNLRRKVASFRDGGEESWQQDDYGCLEKASENKRGEGQQVGYEFGGDFIVRTKSRGESNQG